MHGTNNGTGVELVEVYNLGTATVDLSSEAHLANISRGNAQTGENVMSVKSAADSDLLDGAWCHPARSVAMRTPGEVWSFIFASLRRAGCMTPSNCQMIIAAGEGAVAAQAMNRDLFKEASGSLPAAFPRRTARAREDRTGRRLRGPADALRPKRTVR